jgi:hypothetical protein
VHLEGLKYIHASLEVVLFRFLCWGWGGTIATDFEMTGIHVLADLP